MCYFEYPPELKQMKAKVKPYRAHSQEEDRGDGFIVDTPDSIIEYHKIVLDYFTRVTTGSDGRPLM